VPQYYSIPKEVKNGMKGGGRSQGKMQAKGTVFRHEEDGNATQGEQRDLK
jgi:hypothetical protein